MKNPTPILIARLSALTISLVLLVLLLLTRLFVSSDLSWLLVFSIPVLLFMFTYFIIAYAIEYFIYRRIKLIYKTIYDTKSAQPVKPAKLKMHGEILDDISEEVDEWKKTNKKGQKRMRKMESFRKEFLANVFHELKTPIFNIQGYLETLLEGGLNDPEVNMKFLRKANKNVERITNIVNDLQLISNLEEGSFELEEEKFDITEFVREVLDSLEIIARPYMIKLVIKEGCNKSILVRGDRGMIQQVLTNLVTNSIKYGKKGGLTQIGLYDMSENILIEVSDDGIGIGKAHLPRVFERFYRVDKDRSREQGGSGLGLSIVKHIIERHGMTVNVRSTPGVGTTFGFTMSKA